MPELESTFIRLPPDSTGKRSAAAGRLVINYQGESSPNLFAIGQTVVGVTSTAQGEIVGINRVDFPAGEGQIYIDVDDVSTTTFQQNENLQVAAVTYAQVTSATPYELYYQKQIIVDKNNPHNNAIVDEYGALHVSYTNGSPSISPFSELSVASNEVTRYYKFAYNGLDDEFYDETIGSGSISYISDESAVLLDTNDTASGTLARRTSHFYNPYQPGNSTLIQLSIVCGDTGKSNLRRRWGLFDGDNGVYWELDGTTLYAVIRSKTTGSVVETRVAQSSFNRNTLDGTGKTGFSLDVSKANLYFIDFQWLGVGIVRFGVYSEDGGKLISHVFENPNTNSTSYMRSATLPLRFEVENTDTVVSSSELKLVCAAIHNIGQIKRQLKTNSIITSSRQLINDSSGEVPILTIRNTTGINGLDNHTTTLLDNLTVNSNGDADILIRLRRGSTLSGESWNSVYNSAVEYDTTASSFAVTGLLTYSYILSSNDKTFDKDFLIPRDNLQGDIGSVVKSDGVSVPLTISAEVIDPGVSGNLLSSMTWREIWL